MKIWDRIFGKAETPSPNTVDSVSDLDVLKQDVVAVFRQLANLDESLRQFKSAVLNGEAEKHAMDVLQSSPDAGGGRAFWNTVEARASGGGIVNPYTDNFTGRHTYTIREKGATGKATSKTLDADELAFKGDMVVFLRYNRVVYAVHGSRLIDFELEPRKPVPDFVK